ncbi:ribbon-helix-helix protein, CopG family [Bradyrhizobium sp. WSM1743]|uniref:ribbon-helix-helix protein, CopG family n=1 Tax=Bradyrhizobium sp. WSM1743 TaxID=318996 RepID=UPI0004040C0A|nr:ribbon-helix-helix protein, CopG family [Bradyrhizobium sp. WSM1743]
MQSRPNQYDGNLQVRVPKSFIEQLDAAAHRRMVNRADFVRMALQDRVKSEKATQAGEVA